MSELFFKISTLIAEVATVCSVIYLIKTVNQNRKAIEENKRNNSAIFIKQIFDDVEKSYDKLDELDKSEETKTKDWDISYFNQIELFAFYVNNKIIDYKMSLFFIDLIISAYENIYLKYYKKKSEDVKENTELKILYKKFKKSEKIREHKLLKPISTN